MKKTIMNLLIGAALLAATALIWCVVVELFCAMALWGVA